MNIPKVICAGATSNTSQFTGKPVSGMSYFQMPTRAQFVEWWNKGHGVYVCIENALWPIIEANPDTILAQVDGATIVYDRTDMQRKITSIYVSFEEGVSEESLYFIRACVGTDDNHVPIVWAGGEESSFNISYFRAQKKNGPLVLVVDDDDQDDKSCHKYLGIDFVVAPVCIRGHQLKMLGKHARAWLQHKNEFQVGQLVELKGHNKIHVVVAVYPEEIDGEKRYNMDVVTGNYGVAIPVHSFNYAALPDSEDQAVIDSTINEKEETL